MINVLYGDMLKTLPTLEENSFDSCVTDPPYHLQSIVKRFKKVEPDHTKTGRDIANRSTPIARLARGFMGKEWDGGDIAFRPDTWAEVYRVLKPGAFLVAFSGTRTYHRIACAIEDAGFGRWPANLCHDGSDEVLDEFAKYGESKSGNGKPQFTKGIGGKGKVLGGSERSGAMVNTFSDSGTAARFFYSAKANAKDRAGSKHPTVKPVSLMEWLCTLVTQPGGSILDPFAGSGTTGIACKNLGFNCTLIEREKEYIMDIYKRFEEQQEKEREYA